MTQIERIAYMESILRKAADILGQFGPMLEYYEGIQNQITALKTYYGSQEWHDDFASDAAGLLPPDLRRGVLSEDEVYDLLLLNRELLAHMREIVRKYGESEKDDDYDQ